MSLSEYQALATGLSLDGPIATDLFGRVAKESESSEIPLTGEYNADDARPPFLTSHMLRWYGDFISGKRGTALQEIRALFSAIDLGRGQRGFLLEGERDRIERAKFDQIIKERDQYFSNKKVKDTTDDLKKAKESYEQMKAENGGEDANEWSPFIYVLILTLFAIPEIPLNFQSFASFYSTVPAIAIILVIVIAVAIGISSHIVGTVIKQWGEMFGGFVSRKEKMRYGRFFAIGIFLFILTMAMIFFPRSYLFKAALDRKIVLGEAIAFSDYMGLLVSVGGNFLIWLIGVAVAYFAHSHIPGFGAKQREVKRLQKTVSAMYEKNLQHRKDRHIGKAQKDLTNLSQLEMRQLRSRPDYVTARRKFEEFRKLDNFVVALLEEYRGRLIETIHSAGDRAVFIVDEINSVAEDKQVKIDASAYAQTKLRLPYA